MPSTQDDPLAQEAARIARAISHPVRLQILNELRDGGAYVMHLTTVLNRPQANISQHLMVLRQAGLVTPIREGMTVLYQLSDPHILEVLDALENLAQARITRRATMAGESPPPGGRRRRRRAACRCPRCAGGSR